MKRGRLPTPEPPPVLDLGSAAVAKVAKVGLTPKEVITEYLKVVPLWGNLNPTYSMPQLLEFFKQEDTQRKTVDALNVFLPKEIKSRPLKFLCAYTVIRFPAEVFADYGTVERELFDSADKLLKTWEPLVAKVRDGEEYKDDVKEFQDCYVNFITKLLSWHAQDLASHRERLLVRLDGWYVQLACCSGVARDVCEKSIANLRSEIAKCGGEDALVAYDARRAGGGI